MKPPSGQHSLQRLRESDVGAISTSVICPT